MKIFSLRILSVLALGFGVFALPTIAADATQGTAANTGTQTAVAESGFNVLLGNWVRPDGGYTITITDVDPNGILDASYANPNPLPFAQAKASVNGEAIEVFLELRAGGPVMHTDLGGIKPNPAGPLYRSLVALQASLMGEFGLTPTSRTRIGGKEEKPTDEVEEFFKVNGA